LIPPEHNDTVVFVIPSFVGGVLPPGIHRATWREVLDFFGWNRRRVDLLAGLRVALDDLSQAGCQRAWLDGSFVTEKPIPGDFDLCWDTTAVDIDLLHPALADVSPPRWRQKMRYQGDVLPNVIERDSGQPFLDFFQQDSATGVIRGIVELDPGDSE
jgi:3',5'-cyclic AMP phosphodiesterase CpdA